MSLMTSWRKGSHGVSTQNRMRRCTGLSRRATKGGQTSRTLPHRFVSPHFLIQALSMVLIPLTHSSPQILRTDHAQLASQWIWCKIEDHNEYLKATAAQEADDDGENDVNDTLEEYFHVKVGSPQKPWTFELSLNMALITHLTAFESNSTTSSTSLLSGVSFLMERRSLWKLRTRSVTLIPLCLRLCWK